MISMETWGRGPDGGGGGTAPSPAVSPPNLRGRRGPRKPTNNYCLGSRAAVATEALAQLLLGRGAVSTSHRTWQG